MDCPKVYEKTVVINSRDVDGRRECKASALLGYLQDSSAEHTMLCGCSRVEMVEQYHAFWMLTRICLRLERPIKWLDTLTIRTWHRGGKGVLLYRDYDLLVDGTLVGEATALWVLPDLDTLKLLNTSQVRVEGLERSANSVLAKDWKLRALRRKDGDALLTQRRIHYSDIDINDHVNNTKYADFACDAIRMEALPREQFLSEVEITYHAECHAGETLQITGLQQGETWFVCGSDQTSEPRFDARLKLKERALEEPC